MRLLKICAAALVCLAAAYAQNPTGRWMAKWSQSDEAREIVVALNLEAGGKVTGYIQTPNSADNFTEGAINGSELTLSFERTYNGQARKTTYTATLQGDKLVLTMPAGRAGGTGQKRELTRISTEAPKPLPAPKPLIALPEQPVVKSNGLAKTPPMGWNSWNKFTERVSDKMVRDMADAIVSSGMRDAGYIYVNIDDTWELGRDAKGNITTNSKFPNMKALADYIHGKGLKLGIYSSPGPKTCAGYEGSFQREVADARQFAAWGIDYLKYDWCSASGVYQATSQKAVYAVMGKALLESGHPIVYSLCQYGQNNVGEWGEAVGGNLWRTTGDISDNWRSMSRIGFDQQVGREKFAGPGHWNDPDMLEIGNGGMSDIEYRTHMSLWSLLAAPLLAGNDIRDMSQATKDVLMNKEVIAIDQDKLGQQAKRVSKEGDLEVFARQLADGGWAVGLFNRGEAAAKVTAKWSDIGITGSHKLRDLWAHADLPAVADAFAADVAPHGVVMIKVLK
jgi:alpha-galactosidase